MKKVMVIVLLAAGTAWAAEDPPSPGGFRLRSEASTFAGPTADKTAGQDGGQVFPKPYSPPCIERENVFDFTQKPAVKNLGNDKYEITFAVKGNCDVTVGIIDPDGKVVRHLGSGVLGANAPAPFQPTTGGSASGGKISLKQTIYWNGKDDLDVYHKTPEKLKVRVMLGLKPTFDKRLGGTSGKSLPGYTFGIATGPDGAYVFVFGTGGKSCSATVRHFDHDGNYVKSLTPPPENLPEGKLSGLSYVEYEPGKKAIQGANIYQTVADRAHFLPGLNGQCMAGVQPALSGNRIFWANHGFGSNGGVTPKAYYFHTDGSTDLLGMRGQLLLHSGHRFPRLAASPDGKWIYMAGLGSSGVADGSPVVVRISASGQEPVRPFLGKWKEKKKDQYDFEPGSDNESLNSPAGIDCDAEGRIYVADHSNSRIQIFSPDGKYLKTVPMDRPTVVRVHQKTGAIYVVHAARVQGRSVDRITKLASFASPTEIYHVDDLGSPVTALDSWAARPRLWLAGRRLWCDTAGGGSEGLGVRIYEEDGNTLKKIADFAEDARKEAGDGWFGGFGGTRKVICDPARERVVYGNTFILDLKTGAYLGQFKLARRCFDDIAFDKKGYMHVHWNPCFEMQGVSRVDPSQARSVQDRDALGNVALYPEVPYDYGVEIVGQYNVQFLGILPVKDQGGAKGFQDGIGVNMRGDVATESNIYFVPKMEEVGREMADMGPRSARDDTGFTSAENSDYASFMKQMEESRKRGEEIYSIRRRPGIPLAGGTVWIFDSSGELRKECAVNEGKLINGVQIDENGATYFVTSRPRAYGETYFLAGKGGTFGDPGDKSNIYPFTGSLVKSVAGKECVATLANAPVPMEERPSKPADLMSVSFADVFGKGLWCWMEGAEWIYAGASPIVSTGCSCPTQRLHTDWYKRTFVPEAYRHSFGVVDTAGNLIMHLGRYGNMDSANAMKAGAEDIPVFNPRFISGTDNYLCFEDWSERLVVLKLNYHAEESVGIGEVMSAK